MRISDWSSDLCSSDLSFRHEVGGEVQRAGEVVWPDLGIDDRGGCPAVLGYQVVIDAQWLIVDQPGCLDLAGGGFGVCRTFERQLDVAQRMTGKEIGRASCRESVCQYV